MGLNESIYIVGEVNWGLRMFDIGPLINPWANLCLLWPTISATAPETLNVDYDTEGRDVVWAYCPPDINPHSLDNRFAMRDKHKVRVVLVEATRSKITGNITITNVLKSEIREQVKGYPFK
jgi:hypothetical protein